MSEGERKTVRRHTDLEVYRRAFKVAMRIFELTKSFPQEERYAMVDQIREIRLLNFMPNTTPSSV